MKRDKYILEGDARRLEERIKKTEYLVEADSFASQCLWERYASEAVPHFGDWPRYSWENQNPGMMLEIGQLEGLPVMVTFFWRIVGGMLLCFFSGDSRVTDHQMIRAFLNERFPGVPVCDAMNFHHVLERVRSRHETAPLS